MEMEPPPGVAPGWPAYRADASLAMLWGHKKWSARDDLHPASRRLAGLPDPKSGGSAIPREPGAEKLASLTGPAQRDPVISCMRGRHVSRLHHRDSLKHQTPGSKFQR